MRAVYSAGRAATGCGAAISIRSGPVWVHGEIRTGYTCNVLMRRASHGLAGRRFNLARGQTGGEDTEYFGALHEAGGVIAFAPNALTFEDVPRSERAFAGWRRRFRTGQTHGRLLAERRSAGAATQAAAIGALRPRPAIASPWRH